MEKQYTILKSKIKIWEKFTYIQEYYNYESLVRIGRVIKYGRFFVCDFNFYHYDPDFSLAKNLPFNILFIECM
jgi:tRNA splicing endonuclease